ncbi:MAG: TetR/AcrR family transcriptional regulator [Burkholderiaceae bacterium]|jgi:TetR/AcrR family transcriptional repressor of nem operon
MRTYTDLSIAAERIVDVAESLIQRQGFNGFSYDNIARAVGIRKPSVHHHFVTKADLVTLVTQRYVHRFITQLERLNRRHALPKQRLLGYAQLFQDTGQSEGLCSWGMLVAESERLPTPIQEHLQAFFNANLLWLTATLAMAWLDVQATRSQPPGYC